MEKTRKHKRNQIWGFVNQTLPLCEIHLNSPRGGVIEALKFSLAGNSEAAAAETGETRTLFSLEPVLRRHYFLGKVPLEYQSSVRSRLIDFVCGESSEPTQNIRTPAGVGIFVDVLWKVYVAGATGVLNQVGEEVGPHLRLPRSCFTGVLESSSLTIEACCVVKSFVFHFPVRAPQLRPAKVGAFFLFVDVLAGSILDHKPWVCSLVCN